MSVVFVTSRFANVVTCYQKLKTTSASFVKRDIGVAYQYLNIQKSAIVTYFRVTVSLRDRDPPKKWESTRCYTVSPHY